MIDKGGEKRSLDDRVDLAQVPIQEAVRDYFFEGYFLFKYFPLQEKFLKFKGSCESLAGKMG